MATLNSSRTASGDQPRYAVAGPVVDSFKYTMTITGSAGDVIEGVKVGPGARVLSIRTWADAATLTYSVGDGTSYEKFLTTAASVLTAWTTGSTVTSIVRDINVGGGFLHSYSTTDTIDIRIASGGLTGTVVYCVVELAYDQTEQS